MTVRQMVIAAKQQEYEKNKPTEKEIWEAHLRIEKQAIAMGYMTEGMCSTCYGDHKNDPVELPDSAVQQVKDLALTSAKDNYGWNDTPYLNDFIRTYIPTVSNVEKRLATSTALTKVWREEVDRIGWYIHSQDPNWTNWGQHFDVSILDNYRQGVDIRA